MQMSSQGRQIVPTDFIFNNDLEYLRGGSNDKKYTTSTTKYKAARNFSLANQMLEFLWLYYQNGVQERCLFDQEDFEHYQCQGERVVRVWSLGGN
uniref:Uncharacterized protein n=1 Tax=Tanacetum cinerariifolium TaxID=118510 RepID=A0A699URX6_TANCI|nr:hypothetical protein [Tanacetum cinerariifolium]